MPPLPIDPGPVVLEMLTRLEQMIEDHVEDMREELRSLAQRLTRLEAVMGLDD